ncbi:MAG: hypothetical protein NT038_09610 [Euryarchaeota archaeon]|jgi:hypothetical protein|nr:hypothetical protein [Euryarchaeota archaeon]
MVAIVKIVQLGTEIKSYAVESGSTVYDLFEQAEREFVDGEVTRNQRCVSEDDTVRDGDTFYVAKMVKGNVDPYEVEIFRLGGGRAITLPASDGMSIKTILEQLSPEEKAQFFRQNGTPAFEFRINGEIATIDSVPSRPASGKIRVICSQVVKGN